MLVDERTRASVKFVDDPYVVALLLQWWEILGGFLKWGTPKSWNIGHIQWENDFKKLPHGDGSEFKRKTCELPEELG